MSLRTVDASLPFIEPFSRELRTLTNPFQDGGLFSRRRSSSASSSSLDSDGHKRDRHHKSLKKDPTITAARQKVADAETSEREADKALNLARAAVKEARQHVKILEKEAMDEAKRAKAKQAEAKTMRKMSKGLGRHG
ncbi:hypothetical protein NLI96_g849 [Meripilus lineatus]|uniref:Uncharacterized protein n=1 Tax=Meripilus lineatus TaxID=2056292 RepID=A0AAD5VBJ1_9APHY|nr:hypothetical protein NLI96_g849 [Physisporinus lineatus]